MQAKFAQAEPLYRRALSIFERSLGPEDASVGAVLHSLGFLYHGQDRFAEAEEFYKRAIAITKSALGPEHASVATTINSLALLYSFMDRYDEAELLYKKALEINEKALGSENRDFAQLLANLAILYSDQGRRREAIPLLERAVSILETVLGSEHPAVSGNLSNLAAIYMLQDRFADAEPLLKRALAITESAFGPDHPDLAMILGNLSQLNKFQKNYADAASFSKRALSIMERSMGPENAQVAHSLMQLGGIYGDQDKYAVAYPLYKRALAIYENGRGPDHTYVALILNQIAWLRIAQGRYDEALIHARRATDIYRKRAYQDERSNSTGNVKEQIAGRNIYVVHAKIVSHIIDEKTGEKDRLLNEAFEVGQLAQVTSAAAAVAQMGARFATGDDALSNAIRARQDAIERWRRLDARLVTALSEPRDKRDASAEATFREELETLEKRIDEFDARLAREFAEYSELANPQPLPLNETQKLLGNDEALITYVVAKDDVLVWVVRHDREMFRRLDIGRQELEDAVTTIRGGLDQSGLRKLSDIRPFDTEEAFLLYEAIFEPAEPMLEGVRHVFVVPDGALQSLPLGVLVTKIPKQRVRKLEDYAAVPWLAKKYAMTILPSVSSLRALRQFAKTTKATQSFVGFGDPLLDGDPVGGRGIDVAALFTRGAVADVDSVRKLPRLPDTADELRALAAILHADNRSLFLGERATESAVRTRDLSRYRVIAFATHGLVAGELAGVAEPALVLTPPKTGSESNDGLLTASEIATLKLNADLVILSACNTAAADGTPGAEGLSGLAKAFFYAGTRALLVSHWSVNSEAAVAITTGMLGEMAKKTDIGRAEALRRSMIVMMKTEGKDHFAHPMFWAPFVVVGEGGAAN